MKTKVQIKKINRKTKHQFLVNLNANEFEDVRNCCCSITVPNASIVSFRLCGIFLLLLIFLLNLADLALCNAIKDGDECETTRKYANESLIDACELCEESNGMIWSQLLEDYVLSQSTSSRSSKDLPFMSSLVHEATASNAYGGNGPTMLNNMNNQQAPINYHSSAYKRPNVYITKRIGEPIAELEPHMRPPIVNPQFRPLTNQMVNQEQRQTPGFLQQLFGLGGVSSAPQQQHIQSIQPPQQQQHRPPIISSLQQQQHQQQQHHILPPSNGGTPFRPVSENDLYLLGAIEKMVYRVDYLESRIRRAEQLIYYLMAGNNQKEVKDPCPTNFTRISDNCYYINIAQQVNWKTANTVCKGLGAHLAEFEKGSENEEIMAYLLNQQNYRGHDYWLGGLNPGLLWIWSNSAKPVNPNMNLTSIALLNANSTESNLIDHKDEKDKKDTTENESILNNTIEIKGQGRCLRLTYNEAKHSYGYYGQECTSRHHFVCEFEDKTLDNKIKKISRDLKLFD